MRAAAALKLPPDKLGRRSFHCNKEKSGSKLLVLPTKASKTTKIKDFRKRVDCPPFFVVWGLPGTTNSRTERVEVMYTLEEIYLHHARSLMIHYPKYIIADAINEGYTVTEAVQFLLGKGYNKYYIEEELEALRRCSIIAPWEPD